MSKREPGFYFIDIFIAIYKIELYTLKFTNGEELLDSMLEWDATLRELEIIGEATNSLIKLNILDNKEYRKIVDFRNIIIHGYFGIDEFEVWSVVKYKLPSLSKELKEIIKKHYISTNTAIDYAKEENRKNKNIINFLNELSKKLS
jgi:uncharacterized protein with HEPN domain